MGRLKFVWNIPNTLSLVRLALLPFFALLYFNNEIYWALAVLLLSGLTDLFDGVIARKCNQITEIGKLLDPFADKITQVTVLVCLTVRTPALIPLLLVCFVKELLQAIGGFLLLSRFEIIRGSKWFGKVSTFTFYAVMLLVALWETMPDGLFTVLVALVAVTMLFSFFGYMRIFINLRREGVASAEVTQTTDQ